MKTKILLINLFILSAFSSFAQTTFQKTFGATGGAIGYSVQQTSDSGYIICGTAGNDDVYLIRTNVYGDTLWTRIFGNGTDQYYGYSAKQTFDKGYIISGLHARGTGGGIYLIKTDANGDTLWTKFTNCYPCWGDDVEQTSDSGYILLCTGHDLMNTGWPILIKTTASGNILWGKEYRVSNFDRRLNSVEFTNDGGYIMVGYFNLLNSYEVYLVKTNSIGDTLWTRAFGGTGGAIGSSVQQTFDSGYIIIGETSNLGDSIESGYLVKTNSHGDTLWTQTYANCGFYVGQQTSDGGYIMAGYTSTNEGIYLLKTDDSGNPLWSKTYGGAKYEEVYSLQQTSDNGYIITGSTTSFGDSLYGDIYLIKTDSMGNSGCNENSISTVVNSCPTQIIYLVQGVSPLAYSLTTQITIVGSGGDQTNLCSSVSINKINFENDISIYPNPLTSSSTLQFNTQLKNAEVVIYDMVGKEIMRKKLEGDRMEIEKGSLQSGVYFVRVSTEEKQWVEKMMVE